MEANAGYSTELLARAVGPMAWCTRRISAAVVERLKDKFDIRAQKPAMKNVVHVVRNFDDPIPPDVGDLDLITFFFAYHDMTYMPVDRAEMNWKMFAALKPGGFLVIADHSARPGDGDTVGKTLHRIEEAPCAGKSRLPVSSWQAKRFPASSRGPARRGRVPSAGAGRRVRTKISKAVVRLRVASTWHRQPNRAERSEPGQDLSLRRRAGRGAARGQPRCRGGRARRAVGRIRQRQKHAAASDRRARSRPTVARSRSPTHRSPISPMPAARRCGATGWAWFFSSST